MLRQICIALVAGFTNCLLCALAAPFLVTWGAPKTIWAEALAWAAFKPIAWDVAPQNYFMWVIAANGAIWGLGLYGLYRLLRRLQTARATVPRA